MPVDFLIVVCTQINMPIDMEFHGAEYKHIFQHQNYSHLKDLKIFGYSQTPRVGRMYRAFKKEFSTSYLFEEYGTSEGSE